jgi:uncharacterized coiled-coil DUF342 family protein
MTEGGSAEAGEPGPELAEQFRQLEARVDGAVALVRELRHQQRELEARLAEERQVRSGAVSRIDALLDKIDGLL